MKQWVLSVAGIAILSVIADVILPNGQTRKYIKTVIGVVVTMVLAQPIFSLLNVENYKNLTQNQMQIQQQYLQYVEEWSSQNEQSVLENALISAGFNQPEISVLSTDNYVVTFSESYTAELLTKAKNDVSLLQCDCVVTFLWNNSELL